MDLRKLSTTGFRLDYESFFSHEIISEQQKLAALTDEIFSLIGQCDLNESKSVSRQLYKHGECARAGLPIEWLKEHREVEIYDKLYRFKCSRKFVNQYGEKFRDNIGQDGRIHPTYYNDICVTGRLSARNPPALSLDGRVMKYITADEGNALLHFDFKTMDFRSLAALSRDPFLKDSLQDNEFDIHLQNAAIVLEKDKLLCSEADRKIGKSLGLAIIYGMSGATLAKIITQKTGKPVSVSKAESFREQFYRCYPVVRQYQKSLVTGLKPCKTISGKTFDTSALSRSKILNYPVQGSTSEAFEFTLSTFEAKFPRWNICLPIHDSIYVEVDAVNIEESKMLIKKHLETLMSKFLNVNCFVHSEVKSEAKKKEEMQ